MTCSKRFTQMTNRLSHQPCTNIQAGKEADLSDFLPATCRPVCHRLECKVANLCLFSVRSTSSGNRRHQFHFPSDDSSA